MRVLVTGGSGFIGRRLCEALRERAFEVWAPSRQEWDLVSDAMPDRRVDKVFHLAGRSFIPDSWKEPADFYRTNVQGTVSVLDFCRNVGAALLYVSGYCYGIAERFPIHETSPLRPNNPYAFSKVAAETACRFFSAHFHIPLSIVRPFNVYGPGQSAKFLIPHLIEQALDPAASELVVRDSRPRRDFIHVDDLVAALCTVPVRDDPATYNVGSGRSFSVREIAELVERAATIQKPIVVRGSPRIGEIPDAVADIAAIRAVGWRPRIGLVEGLRDLVAERQRSSDTIV